MRELDIDLFKFNDINLCDKKITDKGNIFVALNLFSISHFEENFKNNSQNVKFWCDGIFGVIHLKQRGIFTKKIAGPKFFEILLSYINKKVVVVGNLDKKELSYLNKRDISVIRNIPLLNFRFEDLKKITLESEIEVIITLPSPLQEETAFFLHKKYPNLNFFCIGGALKMLSYPELNAPKIVRKLNIEWLYRFKTDPIRRFSRIFNSICKYFNNLKKIRTYKWSRIVE